MPQANEKPITIALYVNAYNDLNNFQKRTQKAFWDTLRKLKTDPTLSGLHVEPVKRIKNRDIHSIRITRGCRAIVSRESQTNTYYVLHIDEGHDDAYKWAEAHSVIEDMSTNTIRVENTPDPAQLRDLLFSAPDAGTLKDQFAKFSDDDLTGFGVPKTGVPILRAAPSREAAHMMAFLLQPDCKACIDLALEGNDKDDIRELVSEKSTQSSTYGFGQRRSSQEFIDAAGNDQEMRRERTMLTSNGTQQQFVVITDDDDLERLMNAPLAQWRVFLHPTQRAIVNGDYSGPVRVTGGAGTGKTVVAMHRARRLAQRLIQQGSDRKVLLTTFTANLADDIRNNMSMLCTTDELDHIEIVNLDKWLHAFLSTHTKCSIQYQESKIKYLWQTAMKAQSEQSVRKLPVSFFIEEWEQVVLANDIADLNGYLQVTRQGRNTPLTQSQRKTIWPVIEQYRQLMKDYKEYDKTYAMHVATELLDGRCKDQRLAFVVVDEGQDFSASAYRLLRSMVDRHSNDMFITSDNHQQLYGKRVSLRQCGILIAGRSFRLKVNYRTTSEIKSTAEHVALIRGNSTAGAVLQAINDSNGLAHSADSEAGNGRNSNSTELDYTLTGVFDDDARTDTFGDGISLTHGEWPKAERCKSWDAQFHKVADWIDERLKHDPDTSPSGICVIVRNNHLVEAWTDALRARTAYGALALGSKADDGSNENDIRVATMYRAKGLEFDYVIVPDLDQCPPPMAIRASANDANALQQLYQQERNLLYVAMTRPRKQLLVTAVS